MVKNQGERWWNKVEQRHDRSGIGNLIRPEDIYLSPWDLDDRLHKFSGIELDQLGAVDVLDADRSDLSEVDFATRPTMRFHGSIPALIDALNALMKQEARILLTAPNQGEVERLAGLLQEYQIPYRLGSRSEAPGSSTVYSESSYLAGDLRTPSHRQNHRSPPAFRSSIWTKPPPASLSSSARRISPTTPTSPPARSAAANPKPPPSSPTFVTSP